MKKILTENKRRISEAISGRLGHRPPSEDSFEVRFAPLEYTHPKAGHHTLNQGSDLFSAASSLYYVLFGQSPIEEFTDLLNKKRQGEGEARPLCVPERR